jgi:hypothetical protein
VEPRALDALEQLAEYMPAAARDAPQGDGAHGIDGVQLRAADQQRGLWYFPTPEARPFYLDDGRTLIVVDVVDARRLRRLP